MPASIVKSFAQKTGKSTKEVERLWSKAKEAAKENGRSEDSEDFYPYVTSILKKILKVNEMKESALKKGDYVTLGPAGKVGVITGISGDKTTADVKFNNGQKKTLELSDLKLMKESTISTFKEFVSEQLSESVAVDTDTFVGVHGKKPKGHGSWIFFADKYKTDIRKDDYYQTPHAMNYGDAVKLAKKWAAEKKLFRIYVAS